MAIPAKSLHSGSWWLLLGIVVSLMLYLGSYLLLRSCHRFVHYAREHWIAVPGDGLSPARTIWHAIDDCDSYHYYLGTGAHGRHQQSRLMRCYRPLAWAEAQLRAWADLGEGCNHAPLTPRPWACNG